jgi:dihydrodipicolinate synthase/N-acetylneuraminate lyase
MRQHPELQKALSSPIPSIRVPFTRAGDIDVKGLAAYVERCLANGATALMLTWGDSLYSLLTDDEVAEVTRRVVEQTRKRAVVIAADRVWWTGKTVEFARFCRQTGAAVLMVLPPDWAESCTVETLVAHYRAVGQEIPVMLVTNYLAKRADALRLELIRQVYERAPEVVAVKDDVGGEFGARMTALTHERWTVIAGGTKRLHFHLAPHGCQGHLSTLMVYKPEIAWHYWRAMAAGDTQTGGDMVSRIDRPLFDVLMATPGSFDAALHGWGELVGLCGRWRRSPYHSLTDSELESLAAGLRRIGML